MRGNGWGRVKNKMIEGEEFNELRSKELKGLFKVILKLLRIILRFEDILY